MDFGRQKQLMFTNPRRLVMIEGMQFPFISTKIQNLLHPNIHQSYDFSIATKVDNALRYIFVPLSGALHKQSLRVKIVVIYQLETVD